MLSVIRPITPNISPIINGDILSIIAWLTLLVIDCLLALYIANYAAKRFKGDKKKTAVVFICITAFITLMMLCFFGLSAITVKGIILTLIFILSSFEDIKTRECDDFIHVMIVIAGFIGIRMSSIVGMMLSAAFVFAIILGTAVISKGDIGGADIKMATACAFLLGIKRGLLGLILGLMLAICINLFKNNKKEGFPMIPYLAAGFMAAYFI